MTWVAPGSSAGTAPDGHGVHPAAAVANLPPAAATRKVWRAGLVYRIEPVPRAVAGAEHWEGDGRQLVVGRR